LIPWPGLVDAVLVKTSRLASIILVVPILLLTPVHGEDAVRKLDLTLSASTPAVFERVEISVPGMPSTTNPFDPEVVTLDLEVKPPSGLGILQ